MNNKILLLLLMALPLSCLSQSPKAGKYVDKGRFICICNDTVAMSITLGIDYYLGTYQMSEDEIIIGDNELLGKNAYVDVEPCDSDTIEIVLYCWYQTVPPDGFAITGGIDDIYFKREDAYSIETKSKNYCSHGSGIIKIGRDEIEEVELSSGFSIDGWSSCFFDCFDFPLEFGKRYVFRQKHFMVFPIMRGFQQEKKIYYDASAMSITVKYGPRFDIKDTYNYAGECNSCYEEMKKRYSKFFE